MTTKKSTSRIISKTAWLAANDSGPHVAVLPGGLRENGEHEAVKFYVPDSGALLRSGKLREDLREAAIIFTSHPEGTDELMRELIITAAIRGPGQDTLARMIQAGNDLTPFLISEMLVQPKVTPEEVAAGVLPPLDVKMLLEFADRTRSVDAAGNELPITTLEKWASFRHQPDRRAGIGDGAANGSEPGGAVPDSDEDAV